MKTKFTFKNGAVRSINHKAAEILQKAGKGTYQTRDMVADRFDPTPYEPSIPVNLAELEAAAELADDLDSMDRDALYQLYLMLPYAMAIIALVLTRSVRH